MRRLAVDQEEVFTTAEAARILDRHPELVRQWIVQGRLRAKRFGNYWLVTREAIEEFRVREPVRRKRANSTGGDNTDSRGD